MKRNPIQPGDVVALTRKVMAMRCYSCPPQRENNRTAVVKNRLDNRKDAGAIKGGLFLERDLRGCRYWNEADVRVIRRAK